MAPILEKSRLGPIPRNLVLQTPKDKNRSKFLNYVKNCQIQSFNCISNLSYSSCVLIKIDIFRVSSKFLSSINRVQASYKEQLIRTLGFTIIVHLGVTELLIIHNHDHNKSRSLIQIKFSPQVQSFRQSFYLSTISCVQIHIIAQETPIQSYTL